METKNPYQSPSKNTSVAAHPSLVFWSMLCVFASVALGALTGALMGAGIGTFLPGYYRSVFSNGKSPDFDPVAVGIGQGLTQGTGLGALIGIALVALYYWYLSRLNSKIARGGERQQ